MGVPPKHPKMIIFSRKTPWLLGKPTILGNTHIGTSSWRGGILKEVIALSQTLLRLECSTQEDVNLIKNPERNTGYNGSHIWQAMQGGKDSWGSDPYNYQIELTKYNIIFVHKLID